MEKLNRDKAEYEGLKNRGVPRDITIKIKDNKKKSEENQKALEDKEDQILGVCIGWDEDWLEYLGLVLPKKAKSKAVDRKYGWADKWKIGWAWHVGR